MAFTLFLYHSIDDSGSFLSVSPAQFRAQMDAVKRSGRRVLSVAQAADAAVRGDQLSDAVSITFDDGYQSVADNAWPILRDLNMTATVYCVSSLMGQNAAWLPRLFPVIFGDDPELALAEFDQNIGIAAIKDRTLAADPVGAFRASASLPIMTWDTARDLVAEGMDPGGHTQTHPYLTQLDPSDLKSEILVDRQALQDGLGNNVKTFAYPFGDHNIETCKAVADAGYSAAVTSAPGAISAPAARPFEWARIGVWPQVSPWKMRLYLSRIYSIARPA